MTDYRDNERVKAARLEYEDVFERYVKARNAGILAEWREPEAQAEREAHDELQDAWTDLCEAVAAAVSGPARTPELREAIVVKEVLARFTLEDAEWFEKEAASWDDSVMTIAVRDMQEAERTRQPIHAATRERFQIMQKKRDLLKGLGALLRATLSPDKPK